MERGPTAPLGGNLLEETDESGYRTRYFYDDAQLPDRPTRIKDTRGGIKTLEWNRAVSTRLKHQRKAGMVQPLAAAG